jgi:hypothetical protein
LTSQQHLAIVDSLRGVVIESLQRGLFLPEDVTANASLERNEYHKLHLDQLEKLNDAEALYQIGDRLMHGIDIKQNKDLGIGLMIEAARRGHAVALGVCFFRGRRVEMKARAIELLRASADRGHVSGTHQLAFDFQFSRFSQLSAGWAGAITISARMKKDI